MARKIYRGEYNPAHNIVKKEHYEIFKNIQPNKNLWYLFVKRAADIICSLLALIFLSPLFLAVSIAIKKDGGPVFFMQQRIGKDGKAFRMYKFRSMVVNAEEMLKELQSKNEASGPVFKIENDPRVTKVGRFIRKYSIDELPQLINILIGDMSIVGPRPPLPSEVVMYSEYDMQRLKVRPGLTCYWQCGGRSKISVPDYILNKPGKLTAEEFEIMKEHTVNGCKILDSIDMIKCSPMYKYYYDICRSHHERWDGRGYPDGLVGDMIPISAQIVSVADVYDALTSKRVYKPPYSHEKAVDMILNGECGKFNPDIIECLKNCHMELKDILDKMAFENKVNLEIPQYERKKVSSKLELENSENFDKTCKNDNADKEDSFTVLDDDVIFKYNKKNDIIEFSETYAKEFGKARLITNAQKFFYEDPSMTPEEKEKLMNSVNKLNINNPVLNCRIKVRDKNGSPVSRNISIYMHYSNENSGESDGFVGKLVNS